MKLSKIFAALAIGVLAISCDKDDPEVPNENELIANVTLTLTPAGDGTPVVFQWHDENGDGVVDPNEKIEGSLATNTTYSAVISLNGEEDDHEEDEAHEDHDHGHDHDGDVDEEIKDEAEAHQFFYIHNIAGLTITYTDADANDNPIGLETTFTTDDTYTGGGLQIVLRHELNKFASGVANGDITNAGGDNDVDITFQLGSD
ncbi:hypothetical protein [Ochrovirga pacifica]|uniref:hypothetical protein n=1 Tax=Ochrovirga pacifica TaxID=1042376 RepID=UPI0002558EC8|nr:hypothetical protein [Ochrovirga pacifica]